MGRFTEHQLADAKRTDLEALLRRRGETLQRSGGEYRWIRRDGSGEHDSVTIRGNSWFDHKNQIGGDAIGFLQEFDGLSFREAVAELIGDRRTASENPAPRREPAAPPKPRKPFELPLRNANERRVFAYLCKSRGIDREVVAHFVRAGLLYEDAEHHNAVFIATDVDSKPCGGLKKSTNTASSFRQTIEGSDTHYAFRHKGTSGRVFVFEAAVDMLSYITMHAENWEEHNYIALDGLSPKSLFQFLDENPNVREIDLCVDNDEGGLKGVAKITAQLAERGYTEVRANLPTLKDWNEDRLKQLELQAELEMVM